MSGDFFTVGVPGDGDADGQWYGFALVVVGWLDGSAAGSVECVS